MKNIQSGGWVWAIFIGCFVLAMEASGKVIWVCVTCGPPLKTLIGIVSIALGIAGLVLSLSGRGARTLAAR